ncbi:MAG: winged helix-turn-helix domain-containing protein, partial [Actinomycetota bacterium]|nr:winged helix-turn-helix domain-containing protein [Actinomycetota bacterium]
MTISLLGEVAIDGGAAHLSARDRVVLSALSIRPGRSVAVGDLTEALWADRPPPSAGKVVQGCIVRLRRALGTGAIHDRRRLPSHPAPRRGRRLPVRAARRAQQGAARAGRARPRRSMR